MNSIQKATTAFFALVITLVGATLVTAPLALADMQRIASQHTLSVPYAVHNSSATGTPSLRQG